MTSLPHIILDLLREDLGLSIGEHREFFPRTGEELFVVSARAQSREVWRVKGEDYYGVVCELDDRVGFELEDG